MVTPQHNDGVVSISEGLHFIHDFADLRVGIANTSIVPTMKRGHGKMKTLAETVWVS